MTVPVDLRLSTAANVVADYHAADLLKDGRALELSDRELRRIGDRLSNTLAGDCGLARTFVPMQSERTPATIFRAISRNDALDGLARLHFRRNPELADDGVRRVLIKYKRRGSATDTGESGRLCTLYFEHETEVLGRDAIRKVLDAAGFYNSLF